MAPQANAAQNEEVCPVCKTSSYLNKGIRFLINPECYHRMCESCVDRIFASGPNQCPIAGCKRTLRKHRFRKQTFEDLSIEREVDIRKRVMAILNRREEEFETKRDWDDFLEQREEIIANLVAGTDVAATEKQLLEYATENEGSIKSNATIERQESDSLKRHQAEQELLAKTRKEASRQAYEDERKARLDERSKILEQMASGQYDPERYKTSAKRQQPLRPQAAPPAGGLKIKGIKARPAPETLVEKEYDPFMGLPTRREYFTLQDDYPSAKLSRAKVDTRTSAGGYDFKAYYDETLLKAFAGLGCFIEEEVSVRGAAVSKEVATAVAAEQ